MTNKELGEFMSQENYKETSNSLLQKTNEITGAGIDLASSVFLGFPAYSILKPFIQGIRDWKSIIELKQLAYYFREFENLDQKERIDFSLMIQDNEEDFTERLFYYITQLNDKRKASLCGKIGVSYARKKISSMEFMRLISLVQRSNFEDLQSLKMKIERSGFLDQKNINRSEFFTFASTFNSIFSKDDAVLINDLKNLGLAIQEIDTKSFKVRNTKGISASEISKALESFKVIEKFTDDARLLYFHGLIHLD